jgi:hypothetical protein
VSDLIKGVLGGGWSLVLGWIFPAGLSIGTFLLLLGASLDQAWPLADLRGTSTADRSLVAFGAAVTLGVLLAAIQTPLYRILEGYLLWPGRIAEWRRRRHVARRTRLTAAATASRGYRAGLTEERRRRYPDDDKDVVPTQFGNAIRRLELYGWNRYQLNTQVLWYRIIAVVPEPTAKAVDNARANVDFFVALLYGHLLVAAAAAAALLTNQDRTPHLLAALIVAPLIAAASYRLAILATDEWTAAVKALTDLSRVPLARALGLTMPQTLEEERQMWRAVYWLDRAGYSQEASDYLSAYRDTGQKNNNEH